MADQHHEYWLRRASEEATLALSAKGEASVRAHRELALAYRERARVIQAQHAA